MTRKELVAEFLNLVSDGNINDVKYPSHTNQEIYGLLWKNVYATSINFRYNYVDIEWEINRLLKKYDLKISKEEIENIPISLVNPDSEAIQWLYKISLYLEEFTECEMFYIDLETSGYNIAISRKSAKKSIIKTAEKLNLKISYEFATLKEESSYYF